MIVRNIILGKNVKVDPSSSINNVKVKSDTKIAKNCSIYGSEEHILEIGENTYIGMNSIVNGYNAKVVIGDNVSIGQNVNIMSDSGPNMSGILQQKFPIEKRAIKIGKHCWIGAGVVILPGTILADFCVIGANSVVKGEFCKGSVIAGSLAKVIRVEKYEE